MYIVIRLICGLMIGQNTVHCLTRIRDDRMGFFHGLGPLSPRPSGGGIAGRPHKVIHMDTVLSHCDIYVL